KILRSEADDLMLPTRELSIELAARMLVLCGVADSIQDSKFKIQNALDSGAALEKFRRNIELQNGNPKVCDEPEILLDKNLLEVEIKAAQSGFVRQIDAITVGESVSRIGGGRVRVEDKIDFAVGYACRAKIGDEISENKILGILYCRDENQAQQISEKLRDAYKIGEEKPQNLELIKKIIS
ncbi:MAG: hypothetical protein ACR2L1_02160, partial [Pyrinomonadaceae bacterium]